MEYSFLPKETPRHDAKASLPTSTVLSYDQTSSLKCDALTEANFSLQRGTSHSGGAAQVHNFTCCFADVTVIEKWSNSIAKDSINRL